MLLFFALPSIGYAQIMQHESQTALSTQNDRILIEFDFAATSPALFLNRTVSHEIGSYPTVLLGKMLLPGGEEVYFSKYVVLQKTNDETLEELFNAQIDNVEAYLYASWGQAANLVIRRHGFLSLDGLAPLGFNNHDHFANYPHDSWFGEVGGDPLERPPNLHSSEKQKKECEDTLGPPSDDVQQLIDLIRQCASGGPSPDVAHMPAPDGDGDDSGPTILCRDCSDTIDVNPGIWYDPAPDTCGFYDADNNIVVVCTNKPECGGGPDSVLHHELIHAYQDECRGQKPTGECSDCMEREYEAYKKANNCLVEPDVEPTAEDCCRAAQASCSTGSCSNEPADETIANCAANPPHVPPIP